MLYFLLIFAALVLAAAIVSGILITRKGNPEPASFDYLLVLGTTVNGTVPSIMLSERIRAACDYLTAHKDVICVPTGAKTRKATIPEAQCIAQELVKLGIEPCRIWIEPKATSTWQNLHLSLDQIRQHAGLQPKHIGVITSDFHALRVRLTARRLGLSATVMGVRSAHTIFYYPAVLREIAALWYYFLFKHT